MVFSATKFVVRVRVLIRFIDVAKLIAERNYYLFAHDIFSESLIAFVYVEQFDYFISLL